MNIATILFFICYIPELYANYKNKNANIYNLPEKILALSGTAFAFAYALALNDSTLLINYAPLLTLDILALFMRGYYAYKNQIIDRQAEILV
jgi:ABC-type Fe3+ transport system permease subunit